MVNTPTRSPAAPVAASTMAITAPTMVLAIRGMRGSMVEKLLPAMKAQKHAGAIEAIANRKNMAVARYPPTTEITEP